MRGEITEEITDWRKWEEITERYHPGSCSREITARGG
jgi:hypothetical protein